MTSAEPRRALLIRVIDYYAEHGVRDTSLRTLAAGIGTSQRMLHYHFGSREDLLAAVIETMATTNSSRVTELFAQHDDLVEAGRENWRVAADGAPQLGALFFELAAHAMHDHPHASPLRESLVAETRDGFARAYRQVADDDTADDLARLSTAVGRGLLFEMLIDGDRAASDRAIETFIAMVRSRLPAGSSQRRGR